MESDTNTIQGILSFVEDNNIFQHLLSMGYLVIVQEWQRIEGHLNNVISYYQDGQPSYGYNNGNYGGYPYYASSYYYGPSEEELQMLQDAQSLLTTLRNMGLDSLEDDFVFAQ